MASICTPTLKRGSGSSSRWRAHIRNWRTLPTGCAPTCGRCSEVTARILTERALNRAVLARQGLLEPFGDPLPRVLEHVAGIQAQYAPAMYVGLWSRMRSF